MHFGSFFCYCMDMGVLLLEQVTVQLLGSQGEGAGRELRAWDQAGRGKAHQGLAGKYYVGSKDP